MSVDDWIKIHEVNFGSPFEQLFVIKVLAKVNDLDLDAVSSQYHFKDLDGKNRYCDFVIQEGSIRIAIEIDGYDKRNTGQGMSHDDFVDWQRRQAALTAQGWYVLRFANRDVSNAPERCQRYIELLLRDQRSKSQHQMDLENTIHRLSVQLKTAQNQSGDAEKTDGLQREIHLLKNQLELAKKTKPLDTSDKNELQELITKLEQEKQTLIAAHEKTKEENNLLVTANSKLGNQKRVLNRENNAMKTTIWAFTAIIGILIAAGTYTFANNTAQPSNTFSAHNTAPSSNKFLATQKLETETTRAAQQTANQVAVSQATVQNTLIPSALCEAPIAWQEAKNYANKHVAVFGTVREYRYLPKIKGSPTWINLGARYPDKDRLSVVVWGSERGRFGKALTDKLVNRQICIIGTVKLRDGIPQIALKAPRELVFQ